MYLKMSCSVVNSQDCRQFFDLVVVTVLIDVDAIYDLGPFYPLFISNKECKVVIWICYYHSV